jgi:DNA-directed RNA polymerase specialized sigma24 family protein
MNFRKWQNIIISLGNIASMSGDPSFIQMIEGVRRREQTAAVDLVRYITPNLYQTVRFRLSRWRLNHLLEAEDICQAVLAEFFQRLGRGDFTLQEPAQLNSLLGKLVRYRILDEVRKSFAVRRGKGDRATTNVDDMLASVAANTGTPSAEARANDLIATLYDRMTSSERVLAERRSRGEDWAEIARAVNSTPDAVRKKLTRALDRVMAELKLLDD